MMRKQQLSILVGGFAGATALGTLVYYLVRSDDADKAPAATPATTTSPATAAANVPPATATAPMIIPQAGALPVRVPLGPSIQLPISNMRPALTTPVSRPTPGVVYAGGSAAFDELTGTYRSPTQVPPVAVKPAPYVASNTGVAGANPGPMRIMPYLPQPQPATAAGQLALRPIQAMPHPMPGQTPISLGEWDQYGQDEPYDEAGHPQAPPQLQAWQSPASAAHRNSLGGSVGFDERGVARI